MSPSPRYQALIELLRAADTLWNSSRVFFSRWDLSPSQFNLLNLLLDAPGGLTQMDLSRELIMHRSNVTGLIDRLETRKLVARQPKEADRRAHLVRLTPKGQQLLREILPSYYALAEEVWGQKPAVPAREFARQFSEITRRAHEIADRLKEKE